MSGWIQNPFVELKDDSADTVKISWNWLLTRTEDEFQNCHIHYFLLDKNENKHPELALKSLLLFPLTNLCKTAITAMNVIKTKYRNKMDIRTPVHIVLSSIKLANKFHISNCYVHISKFILLLFLN